MNDTVVTSSELAHASFSIVGALALALVRKGILQQGDTVGLLAVVERGLASQDATGAASLVHMLMEEIEGKQPAKFTVIDGERQG